jgi:hypothetical protein
MNYKSLALKVFVQIIVNKDTKHFNNTVLKNNISIMKITGLLLSLPQLQKLFLQEFLILYKNENFIYYFHCFINCNNYF